MGGEHRTGIGLEGGFLDGWVRLWWEGDGGCWLLHCLRLVVGWRACLLGRGFACARVPKQRSGGQSVEDVALEVEMYNGGLLFSETSVSETGG